jgi:DNA topoisomerase-1
MPNYLLVVESPKKAKTIKKYLGNDFTVKASVGHVKDLPKSKLGIDIDHDFTPQYEVIRGKGTVLKEIKQAAKKADVVYLATDPDREGEAIAFHIAEEIGKGQSEKVKRLLFHEITERAIREAIAHPGSLDENKFDSQQARRVLDRLVGYQISPLLWSKIRRGLSAGRVQSVAVRLVVEREAEIAAFKPREYWTLDVKLTAHAPPVFIARLIRIDGKKAALDNAAEAEALGAELEKAPFTVQSVARKERRRQPLPPYITSKLQQDAANRLNFTTKRTMALAQQLYEGIELGEEGAVGLITYMRTDSPRISQDAIAEVRQFIGATYGAETLPSKPNTYKTKSSAQDAHEAIRPTSMKYTPEAVKPFLERDLYRLYKLIWDRFVACQMMPAIYMQTTVDIQAGRATFRASDSTLQFRGWLSVYGDKDDLFKKGEAPEKPQEEEESEGSANKELPPLSQGEALTLKNLMREQHFTQAPPRFTEASLNKELEEKGIGRPSTMATIMSTIQDREYVEKEGSCFKPTELGTLTTHELIRAFPEELDVKFTADLEDKLDGIESGRCGWVALLKDFYGPFKKSLDAASETMRDLKREEIPTDIACEKCGQTMVIKWGKMGQFLACSAYPGCKNTKDFRKAEDGSIQIATEEETNEVCPTCGKPMVVKRGRFGRFLACSAYPECKTAKALTTGVPCPLCQKGEFTERRSKRGKIFYSCNQYPDCKNAVWDRPVAETCPQCNAPILVVKYTKKDGDKLCCANKECGYQRESAPSGDSKEIGKGQAHEA